MAFPKATVVNWAVHLLPSFGAVTNMSIDALQWFAAQQGNSYPADTSNF